MLKEGPAVQIGVSYYYVGNIEEAVKMYSHFLGCDPSIRERDWVRYHLDGGDLALHLNPDLPRTDAEAPMKYGAVVSFTVPDIQQALVRATQHGFRQPAEVQLAPYGKLAELRDPWGNRIALIEPQVPA
jgi:extradiol dioxygenase family protein